MSDLFGKIKVGAEKAAKEADRIARVKRVELDIMGLRREIEGHYTRLGELTYKSSVNNEPVDPETGIIISKITDLNRHIKEKEDEIKKINENG